MPAFMDLTRLNDPDVSFVYGSQDSETLVLLKEAQAYLRHEWSFFGLDGLREESIDWHRDPQSAKRTPQDFGLDINHRDERFVGNIKNTWEKSRHHHLTVLALAFHLTRDERYAAEAATQISDWIEHNPWLMGVHWTHPLEQGIRLLSWIWCWRLLKGSEHVERLFAPNSSFWTSVYQHQFFIQHTYSRGSSANNHLIGEMGGLFCASVVWPIFPESAQWRELARRTLEQEIVKQTFASGINRELAFSYHLFSLEFFLLGLWEGRRGGVLFSKDYERTLRSMIEAIPKLADIGGNLPTYGDSDDAMALQLRPRQTRREKWILEAGKALVDADVPVSWPLALTTRVLGCEPTEAFGARQLPGSFGFEDAGLYVITSNRGSGEEIFILADAGPLGYLDLAAHGHADALSFTLSVGGNPILVDPGTYCYHTEWPCRQYFRGTSAHNTISVDNQDQSVQAGPFLWKRKARVTVHAWQALPEGGLLEASHNGYERLGVLHRRRLTLQGQTIQVMDHLKGKGTHDIALFWHTAPECRVVLDGRQTILTHGGAFLTMQLPAELQPALVRGGEALGWHSPRFGVRVETNTVVCRARLKMPCILKTQIVVENFGEMS